MPVKFMLTDAGNYVIWDTGGAIGERGIPYRQCGEILRVALVRGSTWMLYRQGRAPVGNLPTIIAAKNLYLTERPIPIDPAYYLPQPEPPCATCTVEIGMGEWERMDEWRSRTFAALVRRNSPLVVTAMLTPIATDRARRVYVLHLPEPVADDLYRWRNRG